jgi:hypothetical protein
MKMTMHFFVLIQKSQHSWMIKLKSVWQEANRYKLWQFYYKDGMEEKEKLLWRYCTHFLLSSDFDHVTFETKLSDAWLHGCWIRDYEICWTSEDN